MAPRHALIALFAVSTLACSARPQNVALPPQPDGGRVLVLAPSGSPSEPPAPEEPPMPEAPPAPQAPAPRAPPAPEPGETPADPERACQTDADCGTHAKCVSYIIPACDVCDGGRLGTRCVATP